MAWGYVIRASGPVNWVCIAPPPPEVGGRDPVGGVQDLREMLGAAASWEERLVTLCRLRISRPLKAWKAFLWVLGRRLKQQQREEFRSDL